MAPQKTILIVEDELIFALNLKNELQNLGYNVFDLVSKGENALAIIKKSKPDCIMLDIRLSGEMTGIETAQEIRTFADTPIVFITGYSNRNTDLQMDTIENSIVFNKPFAPEEIVPEIDRFLEEN